MKLRSKLVLYISTFVLVATVTSIYIVSTYLINHRLSVAIEDAVLETQQVSTLISLDEGKNLDISQFNRRDEYYMLVGGQSEAYYTLERYGSYYYIEVFVPFGLQMLRGRFNVTYIIEEQQMIYSIILAASLIVLMISLVGSIIFSSQVVKPVKKLVLASDEMIEGSYDYPLDDKKTDEIGILTQRFIMMRASMKNYIGELNDIAIENKKLYGALTHEIKTPLTSIMGYSELLLTEQVDDDTTKKALVHINEESKKLSLLSEKLLLLSGRKIDRQDVEISTLIEESLLLCKSNHNKAFNFNLEGECKLFIDPFLYTRVITNLLNNSIEAIEENGCIDISLYGDRMVILDDGENDFLDNPFAPFNKGEKEGYHLGLGLSLVKDIIDAHGDLIYIEGKSIIIEFATSLQVDQKSEKLSSYDVHKGGKL